MTSKVHETWLSLSLRPPFASRPSLFIRTRFQAICQLKDKKKAKINHKKKAKINHKKKAKINLVLDTSLRQLRLEEHFERNDVVALLLARKVHVPELALQGLE